MLSALYNLNTQKMSISPIEHTHHQIVKICLAEQAQQQGRDQLMQKGSLPNSEQDPTNTQAKLSKKFTMNKEEEQPKKDSFVLKLVQNIYFQIFITILTVITLVLYDLKTIFLNKENDYAVGIANIIFFTIFMLEILMNIPTQGYLFSFYFYLDIVSTLTLLLDVDFITQMLFNMGGNNFQLSALVAKSKASRAAARAVRVVKIFRLARVAKLYKSTQRARQIKQKGQPQMLNNSLLLNLKHKKNSNEINRIDHNLRKSGNSEMDYQLSRYQNQVDSIKEDDNPSRLDDNRSDVNIKITSSHDGAKISQIQSLKIDDLPQQIEEDLSVEQTNKRESNISRILSDDTIKRIIVIILLIMISIPTMDINNYLNISTQWDFLVTFTAKMLYNTNLSASQISSLIYGNLNQIDTLGIEAELLCFDTPFNQLSYCSISDYSKYRNNDIGFFVHTINVTDVLLNRHDLTLKTNLTVGRTVDSIVLFMNYHKYNSKDACFSIATTIFICLTIIYLLTEFSNSVSELIITPIESMLMMIQSKQCKEEQLSRQKENVEEYETQMVQKAILKIKGLMSTIFGHIGNQLVNSKMINNQPIKINLDESRTRGLFIFTRLSIANMPEIIQILKQDTFSLLNQVALIAQKAAYRYGGQCVRMLDSGFLLVYKIPQEQLIRYKIHQEMDVRFINAKYDERINTYIRVACDFAFYTVLKIQARMMKESRISQLKKDPRFLNTLKISSYNFMLNFCSNMGWADQGIAGSSYKMDTIMISPALNQLTELAKIKAGMTNRFIIAESLYANLSQHLKSYCRCLQIITFAENSKVQKIYKIDFDINNVGGSRKGDQKQRKNKKRDQRQRNVYDLLKEKRKNNMQFVEKELSNYQTKDFVANKKELREILEKSKQFKKVVAKYNQAFQIYVKGDWVKSLEILEEEKLETEPLTQRLINFIRSKGCKPPEDWKGCRPISQLS